MIVMTGNRTHKSSLTSNRLSGYNLKLYIHTPLVYINTYSYMVSIPHNVSVIGLCV